MVEIRRQVDSACEGGVNFSFDERFVNFSFDGNSLLQAIGWQD